MMELWYSPAFLLEASDMALARCEALRVDVPSDLTRVIGEARPAAIFAAGFAQEFHAETWLQLVDPSEQAPDVRMMYLDTVNGRNRLNRLGIEVATFEEHSKEPLHEFMLRTKLDGKRDYGPSTVNLFHVRTSLEPASLTEAHAALVEAAPRGSGYRVGQVDHDLFQVVQVYPNFRGPTNVRLSDMLAISQLKVVDVSRGMSTEQSMTDTPIPTANPFAWYIPMVDKTAGEGA